MMRSSLAVLVAFSVIATGCTTATPASPMPTEGATSTPATATAEPTDPSGEGCTARFLTVQPAGTGWAVNLADITDEFAKTHPGTTFEPIHIPQPDLQQQIQLLEAQGNLPLVYNTPTIEILNQLEAKGEVLDLEPLFEEEDVLDRLSPAAVAIVKQLYGGKLVALPLEHNVEGFWYNKQIFADNDLEPPATWDEFVAIAEVLHQQGIQPFAASGIEGWPIHRLIGNYIFRKLGPDALHRVLRGEASLTDPDYVEGAQAVADLGVKGYFGPAVTDLDYVAASDLFLQGEAAMFYMGSWELRTFSDPQRNQIGEDNVGLIRFPTVTGGAGSADQTPMNVGLTSSVNAQLVTPACAEWLAAVATGYATTAWNNEKAITGFVLEPEPSDATPLTRLVTDEIATVTTPVTYFNEGMTAEAEVLANTNAALLVTGQMTADRFMEVVQGGLR